MNRIDQRVGGNGIYLQDGQLITYGGADFGLFYFPKPFDAFTLKLQFKIADLASHNSGIFICSRHPMHPIEPFIINRATADGTLGFLIDRKRFRRHHYFVSGKLNGLRNIQRSVGRVGGNGRDHLATIDLLVRHTECFIAENQCDAPVGLCQPIIYRAGCRVAQSTHAVSKFAATRGERKCEMHTRERFIECMKIDPEEWRRELISQTELFLTLHDRLPKELIFQRELLISRL